MRRITELIFVLCMSVLLAACSTVTPVSTESSESESILEVESRPESEVLSETEEISEESETEFETEPIQTEPVITEINRYVLTPSEKIYLTDEKMEAYQNALDAVFAHESEVRLTDSFDDNLAILGYLQQNPYSFILSSYDLTEDHQSMYMEYQYSAEECTEKCDLIDEEYLQILNEIITPDMTQLEEVLAVYHYFASRISYDYDWVEAMNASEESYLFPDLVIYEALTTNKGVCHTYSYLCEFAFQQLGIDCTRAASEMAETGEGHMWLIVWIDGIPYHIDPTWDSCGSAVSLRYFGMTDEENEDRGLVNSWSCSIDEALDIACTDDRFAGWHGIADYTLIGDHQMEAVYEDGSTETIRLTDYE